VRLVDRTGPGTLGLNFMWLPTFVGMNTQLIKEIEDAISSDIVGKPLDERTLETAHYAVIEYLGKKFPHIVGLVDYLDGVKFAVSDGKKEET
jgi:hypothetical protein